MLKREEILKLEDKAHELRKLCLDTVVWAGSGHVGGALSAMDIFTILYHKYLNVKPQEPLWEDRDRFVMSKGHVGVGFAPVLADKGYFPKELLKEYNHTGSSLGMHLDSRKVPGVDVSSGSLGHGLPVAVGMALGARVQNKDFKTFCLLGDGECNEGSIWEAAMSIAHYKITNLITIVDRNRCMIDGRTEDVMALEPFGAKWEAFGFRVIEIDGHDFTQLSNAIDEALEEKEKPVVIMANTFKGCGIEDIQDDYKWHYGSFDNERYDRAMKQLDEYYQERRGRVE